MIHILLVIVCCYTLAGLAIYWTAVNGNKQRGARHYVLMANNQAPRIEWYLRVLRRFSLRSGTEVKVTVVDCNTTDETMDIVKRFRRQDGGVAVCRTGETAAQGKVSGLRKWERIHDWGPHMGTDSSGADSFSGREKDELEPSRLLWKLQLEGYIHAAEHAVVVDLRNPAELNKLPL
ncbi:hypothetical protein DNH61_00790 [Paenibacillus sambharensis]|uniref:Uncharacterized protein n=1 Tax=Paenibacillus sambharensis TaxID=1803190 RepID=A0A2W1LGL7_9BACL|nr:hypothetical protein [Paenibacillus sambharensis]PZD97829.1 hypothetical protein DNH61_00790 [Paenibacillus sambharensis]